MHGINFEDFRKGVKLFKLDETCSATILHEVSSAKGILYLKMGFIGGLVLALEIYPSLEIKSFGADYRHFYFNPEYIKDKDNRTIRGMIFHSVIHLLYRHIQRLGNRDTERWNVSSEITTDLMAKEAYDDYSRMKRSVTQMLNINIAPIDNIPEDYRRLSTDEVYDKLKDEQALEKAKAMMQMMDGLEQGGTGEESEGQGQEGGMRVQQDVKGRPFTCNNKQVNDAYEQEIPESIEKLEEKRFDNIINNSYDKAKSRGDTPGFVHQMIKDMNEEVIEKVDWATLLHQYLQSIMPVDFTWSKPLKQMMANDLIFPGMLKDNIYVAIAIDTSGSVSDSELQEFLFETQSILNSYGNQIKVVLLDCDTHVDNVKYIEYGEALSYDLAEKGWSGRGGTSFEPVFNWVDEHIENGEIEKPQVLIYFTDSFGSFPKEEADYPTIWVYNVKEEDAWMPPFGDVIFYESEVRTNRW